MATPKYIKNVFSWEYMFIYLSGAIDAASDAGRGWRTEWTQGLMDIGIEKHQVLNPCKKPLKNTPFNFDDEQYTTQQYRQAGEWDKLCSIMSQIAHMDLRFVDKSDVILANFPRIGVHNKHREALSKSQSELLSPPSTWVSHKVQRPIYDLLRAYEETQVHTYGTIHEIVVARQQRKPVYIVWEGGKSKCSTWLMWLVGHNHVFGSFEDLKSRLLEISTGQVEYNANDWLHLDLGR